MTWREFIYRAVEQAQRGLDPNRSKLTDAEGIAETMAPSVLHEVAARAARNERMRSILSSPFTVSFTLGIATLSDTVLTAYLCESTIVDNSDTTKRYSHILNWGDFVRPRSAQDKKFGWFSMRNGTVMGIVEPGADFSPTTGLTANRAFTCPRVPERPATADTEFDCPEEIVDDAINVMAEMIRGKALQEAA